MIWFPNRAHGFHGLVKQVSGSLVIDVHDLADFIIGETLVNLQVNNFALPVRQLANCIDNFCIQLRMIFPLDDKLIMADDKLKIFPRVASLITG